MVDGYSRLEDALWTPMTERAMHVVFSLADHPNEIAATILKDVLIKFKEGGDEGEL